MTPVPGLAGLSSTTPAAASPCTACGIVPPMRGTRKKCFLAASEPLGVARGPSFGLPVSAPAHPLAAAAHAGGGEVDPAAPLDPLGPPVDGHAPPKVRGALAPPATTVVTALAPLTAASASGC